MKRCTVAFAMPDRQWIWAVELPDDGTVADALQLARAQAGELPVPWDADVGIFGELCERAAVPRDGDRIEVYRPLRLDPKESRRERARARKAALDREPSRLPSRLPKGSPIR
jgi:putative ubiquitin-RnfH superfamily antitoxin RatB of RatAB toxin-antitoxin module